MTPGATLANWIDRHADRRPDRVALSWRGRDINWWECRRVVKRLAGGLAKRGVQAGDRVALMMPNRPEVLQIFGATAWLGSIFVPLNPRFGPMELEFVLENTDPEVVITDEAGREKLSALDDTPDAPALYTIEEDYDTELDGLVDESIDDEPHGRLDQVATIVFTSGTTGTPKGVPHTWRALHWNYRQFIDGLNLTAKDRNFCPAPLSHVAGLNLLTLPLMYLGGMTLLNSSFEPTRVPELVETYDLTCSFMVPAMWKRSLRQGDWEDAGPTMRFGIVGGAPVDASLIRAASMYGIRMVQGYGMTEAGPNVSLLHSYNPQRHAQSVGYPGMHIETRVDSREDTDGESGELVIRGPNVADQYWNNPEETEKSFEDDWYFTGDLARLKEDGEIQLLGRVDELILSGSESVRPREVERVLSESSALGDVAVVGVPDERWGEIVTAAVTLTGETTPSLRSMIERVRKQLADYKAPRQLVVLDALDRTPTGKVDRDRIVSRIQSGDIDLRKRADDERD